MENCIFCKFASGEVPCFKVWEDERFLAFLTPFPNTEGVTVVIPREHYTSYVFDLPDDILGSLLSAAKKVAHILDEKLDDVGRTALVFEGFGVDHVHAKLFPMHGTKMDEWKAIESKIDTYFDTYPGYISSHDAEKQSDEVMLEVQKKITE